MATGIYIKVKASGKLEWRGENKNEYWGEVHPEGWFLDGVPLEKALQLMEFRDGDVQIELTLTKGE
jgi:hypothetical protein